MTEIIHTTEQVSSAIKVYTSMPDIPEEFIVDGVKYNVTIEKEADEMTEVTMEDTIKMMGGDWRDRFRAEYWQVKIRVERLDRMLYKWQKGELDFEPNCPFDLLNLQYALMRKYIRVLEKRAKIEKIDLDRRVKE